MSHSVVDLFSGAGGASLGFHSHPDFFILGAADKQKGKPSSKSGTECNKTYKCNIGIDPVDVDLGAIKPEELGRTLHVRPNELDVLISCSPCTGFSRTNAKNHVQDDPRNSLTQHTASFIEYFQPSFFFIENARELLQGNFSHHGFNLIRRAKEAGYVVHAAIHYLTEFGLPQIRERAIIIGTKLNIPQECLNLANAWGDYTPDIASLTVRNAIEAFPELDQGEKDKKDRFHSVPSMTRTTIERLSRIPKNGGSWVDLLKVDDGFSYLIPSMIRTLQSNKLGSYPDIYGRMWWERPAPTIKRECSSPGNGRYCHPEQNRMCSVRELSYLQGFPSNFQFEATSLSNMYRHIGDSVPPMISYQYAELFSRIIHSRAGSIEDLIMPNTFANHVSLAKRSSTLSSPIPLSIRKVIAA